MRTGKPLILTFSAGLVTLLATGWADDTQRRVEDEAVVDLGRALFFDPILSRDGSISCASCHKPEHAFADTRPLSEGVGGAKTRRNAPSLLGRSAGPQFWDGRAATLEAQVIHPIENELEMASSVEDVIARIAAHDTYPARFDAHYADGVTIDNLAHAIAAFERTLAAGESPADRFMRSEFKALSEEARKGKWIFESTGNCWKCHSGKNFTDELFHNTGIGFGAHPRDLGRFEVTGNEADRGAFKTPGLRNVALTAPYMHDGSMATLRDVVEFYVKGGEANPHLDELMEPIDLSDSEIDAIVAFLESLTSDALPEVGGGGDADDAEDDPLME